jgi:tRNA-specific 2-thiouridylase
MLKNAKKRVIVAMSGGVDSSVAAALLQKQGYDVMGVFFHFWKESGQDKSRENLCCSLESQEEARKVAQILKIPFYTLNVAKEFKKEVVDYFVREYKNGNTPNPCIVCNKEIKFKILLRKLQELKADYIASGHYAKIKNVSGEYKLLVAKDKEKDQSYFLYNLNQKQLAKILFPVSEMEKSEVRSLAKKMKLPVHSKPESQDICFISDGIGNFLKRHIKMKAGNIANEKGNILGKHHGLPLYTLGQRKGIEIGGKGPFFVVGKNARKNQLIVSNDQEALFSHSAMVKKANWLSVAPKLPLRALVRTRYRNPLVYAIIKSKGKNLELKFEKSQRAVTSGQSVVFYAKNGEVLGGGVII